MDLTALSAEFPRDAVHWRPQGKPLSKDGRNPVCMALAYIDARDVMDRLDEVCGTDRWQTEFMETPKGRVICRIGILTENGWVWKGDGAGDTDVESEKGGISDALKRAAVSWGIGRYLYRLKSPWVECEVGNNGQWRKWTQDPWTKVSAPQAVQQPRKPQAPPQPANAPKAADEDVARASEYIRAASDEDDLMDRWRKLPAHVAELAEVKATAKARKAQLAQKKDAA